MMLPVSGHPGSAEPLRVLHQRRWFRVKQIQFFKGMFSGKHLGVLIWDVVAALIDFRKFHVNVNFTVQHF